MKILWFTFLLLVIPLAWAHAQTENTNRAKEIKWFLPGGHLSKSYHFKFSQKFEEISITAPDSTQLSAVLFKADKPKGVIFYLHGNRGAIDKWGQISSL